MTAKQQPILRACGLVKEFFGFVAVDGVDLDVEEGAVHALIGPNGAGKTTVFNLLTNFLRPTAGQIFYRDRDIAGLAPASTARLGLVRSFQISAVFGHLSARENVRIALQRKSGEGMNFWSNETKLSRFNDASDQLLEAVGLQDHRAILAAELPYGRKRALEIATTLALEPEIVLLDVPTAGMDSVGIRQTTELIGRISANRTVLMVEHNMSVVSEICDTITVLARGKVIAQGNYRHIADDPLVAEAYLGASHG